MECPRTRGCELRWRTGRTLHDAALVLLGDLNQVSTRVVEHGCRGGGAHLKRLLSEEHPLRAKPLELLVALIGRVTDAFVRVRTAGCLLPRAAEMRPPDRVRRSACGGLTRRICVRRVPQNAGTGNRSARWMLKSFGFECPHGQHCRNRCPALPKAIEHKSGIHERAQQSGQRQVRCSNLVSEPVVRP